MSEKTVLSHPKLRLRAPCPTAKGKYSILSFDIYDSNPRVVVRTNDPNLTNRENQFGNITAAMEPPTTYAMVEMIKEAIASEGPYRNKIECYRMNRNSNTGEKPTPVHSEDVVIGKDDNGCVFISAITTKEEWPKVKFVFGPEDSRFHKIMKSDGTEYSKAELSVIYARAYVVLLQNVLSQVLVRDYVHKTPQYGGGGNKNSGGYNKPAKTVSEDDDIPW